MDIEFRLVTNADIEAVAALEKMSFSEEDAETLDQMKYKLRSAPELCLGCFENNKVIGFICSTRYPGERFNEDSMKHHYPDGENICIHSVCVHPSKRHQGIATKMLKYYIENTGVLGATTFWLLSRPYLINLYNEVGFKEVGKPEAVAVHGSNQWIEMEMEIE